MAGLKAISIAGHDPF